MIGQITRLLSAKLPDLTYVVISAIALKLNNNVNIYILYQYDTIVSY